MAITRFARKPSKFKFDGTVIGLRRPTVNELSEITRRRGAYLETLRKDLRVEKADPSGLPSEGDAALLLEIEAYASGLLCCDPDDANSPWFARDKAEQAALATAGIEKDTTDDVPAALLHLAFQVFTVSQNRTEPVDLTVEEEGTEIEVDEDSPLSEVAPTSPTMESVITSA